MKTKERRYRLIMIGSHRKMDHIMHAADLFENFKVLIENPLEVVIVLKKGDRLATAFKRLVTEAKKETPDYRMVAMVIVGQELHWADPTVKVISTGRSWCLLKDFVKMLQARET